MLRHRLLYFGESAGEKQGKLLRRIRKEKYDPNLYLVALPLWDNNQLEIYPALTFKEPYFKEADVRIVGIALGKDEATALVETIVGDVYAETGGTDMRRYFQKDEESSWQSF